MVTVENPYLRLPSTFIPENFYGSQTLVQLILEEISGFSPHSLELIGLPGMGKSTVLRYLAHPQGALDKNRDWLQKPYQQKPQLIFPVLVEFRLRPTYMHPFIYLYHRFHDAYLDYRKRAKKVLECNLPEFTMAKVEADVAVDTIEQNIKMLADYEIRPVFLLDDFDLAFEKPNMTRDQATRLRPLRDSVAFILVTERPLHRVNPDAAGSPFFQTLPLKRFDGLTLEEARCLITEPLERVGYLFPSKDVDFVLQHTDGHSFLLILGGGALWDTRQQLNLLEKQDTPLSEKHLTILRGRMQKSFEHSFQLYWDRLELNEREALIWLLSDEETSIERHSTALASLQDKGVVRYNLENEQYDFFSPLFANFIRNISGNGNITPPVNFDLELTGLEMKLYEYLRSYKDRICTFEELSQEVWDHIPNGNQEDMDQMKRRIQVTVSRLRKKIQQTGEDIIGVRDQGYRFIPHGS